MSGHLKGSESEDMGRKFAGPHTRLEVSAEIDLRLRRFGFLAPAKR